MPDAGAGGIGLVAAGPGMYVQAFDVGDLNPLTWLGDAATAAVDDVWRSAMVGLWSAGLWLLQLAFRIIDELSTPDLTAEGPMAPVLPTTLWLGATVAGVLLFLQTGVLLLRRDGASLARVTSGALQFGAVWAGYLGVGAGLMAAAAGLQSGILSSMLDVGSFAAFDVESSWPRDVVDTTLATVLGVLSLLLVIPAAFAYMLIMFVREAALIVLVVTTPITAAGLLNDSTKLWFWKSLRWFFSCLLIAPMAALVLGVGVRLSAGVVAGSGEDTAAAAGTAVVGVVLVAIGAVCPLVLFRLLAFVDPGTASGAALRQSWGAAGGLSGVLSGRSGGSGARESSSAARTGDGGRSGGEAAAEAQSAGRLAAALGPTARAVTAGIAVGTSLAVRAADIGSAVLGQAGVGDPGYGMSSGGPGRRQGTAPVARNGAQPGAAAGKQPPAAAAPPPSSAGPPIGPGLAPKGAAGAGGTSVAGGAAAGAAGAAL